MISLVRFTLLLLAANAFAEEPIRWLVTYDGAAVPAESIWTTLGKPQAEPHGTALRLVDSSTEDLGAYRAKWTPEPNTEIIFEATLRVLKTTGAVARKANSTSVWPWRDGAPVSILVSDGQHQEGLVFYADKISTWTDRFALTNAADTFHTYRAVIRGTDMSVAVDGQFRIQGQNAFWKPAAEREAFIQFGSNSKSAQGEAEWQSVRLGVRKITTPPAPAPVKITVSAPWSLARPELKKQPTRPYLTNLGDGRILMSQAQGPDAIYEPYGVLLSRDEGKTWSPLPELDLSAIAPLPIVRRKSGAVLGMSRWTWPQPDGTDLGRTVRWNADLTTFTPHESRLHLPPLYRPQATPFTCERHAYEESDGALVLAGYSKTGPSTPEGTRAGRRYSHLLRSVDDGLTWNHFAVIGAGGEPAIARLGEGRMTALLRTGPFRPLAQSFSADHGQTWSPWQLLEEGSVCPDLLPMSNGLLAACYGRPASCLMFSADGGHTWSSHHVVTDKTGFNYSGMVEIRPGRLLYLQDAGGLQAMTIDVERIAPGRQP